MKRPKTVLIVDDDVVSLQVIRRTLEKAGHTVEAYANPQEALAALTQTTFDAVVSDYFMPDMDGEAFLQEARKVESDIPVVFLTVSEETGVAVRLLKAGGDDFLTKPVDQHELMFRIDRAIEHKKRDRQLQQVEKEQELRALEERSIVNWRLLYGSKDIAQTKEIVQRLSRSINQGGGFLCLDLLEDSAVPVDQENVQIPSAVYNMILESGKTQRSVFDQVTFVSSVTEMDIETERVDVRKLTDQLVLQARTTLDKMAPDKDQEYRIHQNLDETPREIQLNPELYGKILNELIVNAVKYGPPGSRIDLWFSDTTRQNTAGYELTVWNGARPLQFSSAGNHESVGVPYEYSERVFDLFFTIDAFPNIIEGEEWQDGTGLYVIRELAKRFGGWAECRNITFSSMEAPQVLVETKVFVPYVNG